MERSGTQGFEIVTQQGQEVGIRCLTCNSTSYHPADVAFRYCGRCHHFHDYSSAPPHDPQHGPLTDEQLVENRRWFERDLVRRRLSTMLHGQPWTRDWDGPPLTPEAEQETAEWIRGLPPKIQALTVRFPPGCLVRTKEGESYGVPGRGLVAIVYSYAKNGEELTLTPERDSASLCGVKADHMELAKCYRNLSPPWVEACLKGTFLRIREAIRWPDGNVMVFDQDGEQVPWLQRGGYEVVRADVLAAASKDTIFTHAFGWRPPSSRPMTREEW